MVTIFRFATVFNINRCLRSVSVFIALDVNHADSNLWELSDRYRIATDTGCSYQILSASVVLGKTRYYLHHLRFGSC